MYGYPRCVWHWRKTCLLEDSNKSMEELYSLTMIKNQKCLDLGFNYRSMGARKAIVVAWFSEK